VRIRIAETSDRTNRSLLRMPFARRVRRGERVSGEDGAYRGNGTSFNSETRRNGGRKAVVMEYADAAACAASDQPTPRGRKLPMRHTQLVPTGCRLIARPGPWPGRHRQVSRDVIRALRVSVFEACSVSSVPSRPSPPSPPPPCPQCPRVKPSLDSQRCQRIQTRRAP